MKTRALGWWAKNGPRSLARSRPRKRDLDFLGALSTLFNSTDTHLEHSTDMPCPMCASALVANLLGASAVGTAGGVAALKMKDKTRKVKSKPKPKTAKAK